MLDVFLTAEGLAALLTLTAMEIVLGIDNVVFISVLTSKLPPEQAARARQIGIGLALVFRIIFLLMLTWLIGLTAPVVFGLSWRDIILIAGGLFLLVKGTLEIHNAIEGTEHGPEPGDAARRAFAGIVAQIIAIDLVFSVDSIVTAIGMAEHVEIMIVAVIISMAVMFAAAGPIGTFIAHHPTTKMLALAFLLLIGVSLVADGFGFHIPRGYVYAAMAFSAAVEAINILARSKEARRNGRH